MKKEFNTPTGKVVRTLAPSEMRSMALIDDEVRRELFKEKYAELTLETEKIELIKKFVAREVFW